MNLNLNLALDSVIRVYLNIPAGKGSLISFEGAVKFWDEISIGLRPQRFLSNGNDGIVNYASVDSFEDSVITIQKSSIVAWEYMSGASFIRCFGGTVRPLNYDYIKEKQAELDKEGFKRKIHIYDEDGPFCKGHSKHP
jgi:hypothetical protein